MIRDIYCNKYQPTLHFSLHFRYHCYTDSEYCHILCLKYQHESQSTCFTIFWHFPVSPLTVYDIAFVLDKTLAIKPSTSIFFRTFRNKLEIRGDRGKPGVQCKSSAMPSTVGQSGIISRANGTICTNNGNRTCFGAISQKCRQS